MRPYHNSEGVLLAGRPPLELDEVVVGAICRHQRARVLKVLTRRAVLARPLVGLAVPVPDSRP